VHVRKDKTVFRERNDCTNSGMRLFKLWSAFKGSYLITAKSVRLWVYLLLVTGRLLSSSWAVFNSRYVGLFTECGCNWDMRGSYNL
jgi:hypothetical protein